MKRVIVLIIVIISGFGTFAQKSKNNQPVKKTAPMQAIYTCPMHPDVSSDKPGKCPKCGMDLTRSKKEQMKMEVMKNYTCPMHPNVTSDKPGKCPKCGMNMAEKKTRNEKKMNM